MPFHLSYLLYLSRVSEAAMMAYLRIAITICRLTGTEPSFLLHPLDLLGGDQAPALRFFPGDGSERATRKVQIFIARASGSLQRHFRLVNMSTHARAISPARGTPRCGRPRPAGPAASTAAAAPAPADPER